MVRAASLVVEAASRSYPVVVGHGALDELPAHLDGAGLHGRLWLVSDAAVYPLYGAALEARLQATGCWRWAAASSPTWPASWPRPSCAASPSCRYPPLCWPRWTRALAAKPA